MKILAELKNYCEVSHVDKEVCTLYCFGRADKLLRYVLLAVYLEHKYDWIPECVKEQVLKWYQYYSEKVADHNVVSFLDSIPVNEFEDACKVLRANYKEYFGSTYSFATIEDAMKYLKDNEGLIHCVGCITSFGTSCSNAPTNVARYLEFQYDREQQRVSYVGYLTKMMLKQLVATEIRRNLHDLIERAEIMAQMYDEDTALIREELISMRLQWCVGGKYAGSFS